MERLHFARICVEVSKNAHLPKKIRVNTAVKDSTLSVDIRVDYHSRPKPRAIGRTASLKGTRWVKEGYKPNDSLKPDVSRSVPSVTTGPLLEGPSVEISSDAISSITEVDVPSDLPVSDAQIDRFPTEVPSVVACISSGIVMNPVVAEGSVLDVFDSVNSFAILQDPENLYAMELVGGFLSQESARTTPGISSSCAASPCSLPLQADVDPRAPDAVGSVADSLDALGPSSIDSDVQSSDLSPFKVLDQTQFFKRVRFALEILSAEAPSSAPRCRVLAPCSDICHPIKFHRSTQDCLSPVGVPMDDGPIPGADVELFPPFDGVAPEMELAPAIDPNLTPSPIARIVKKYSLGVSKFEEPTASSSVGSSVRAKEKSRSRIKPCKSKMARCELWPEWHFRSVAFGPEWKGVRCVWNAKFPECCFCLQISGVPLYLGSGVPIFSKMPEWLALE
ncbi:hypothetical protein Nepgr_018708 [Nepenthes gracilis]|uniref:Uncharacterized protein n=1 Tax=Nepenthes gracilis TaxID=150966 RepID=A0AAD3STK4_NEPGR|nr:hypothetical protein Nepgr_018708 [Nepenthes gracilis]